MPVTKRRHRSVDPLASRAAVRGVLEELRLRLPGIPRDDAQLLSLLRAAAHVERSGARGSGRGRRSRWDRSDLLAAASALREILGRGTYGRKGVSSFVTHYLRVLDFPSDVVEALEGGSVNLFEAEQLARLTPRALGATAAGARTARDRVLRAHLAARESGARLRARVDALVGLAGVSAEDAVPAEAARLEAELGEWPASLETEPTAVFFDLLSTIGHALNEVGPGDLGPDEEERLFRHADEILLILARARRRAAARARSGGLVV